LQTSIAQQLLLREDGRRECDSSIKIRKGEKREDRRKEEPRSRLCAREKTGLKKSKHLPMNDQQTHLFSLSLSLSLSLSRRSLAFGASK